jgi:hypothetical protein
MKKLFLMVPILAVMLLQFASPPAFSHGYGWYARRGIPYGGYHHGWGGYGFGGGYPAYGGWNNNYYRGYGGYGGYPAYGGYGYGGYGNGFAGGISRFIRGF